MAEPKKSGATALKGKNANSILPRCGAGMDENRVSIVDELSGQSQ
jgi:hypothetical protein